MKVVFKALVRLDGNVIVKPAERSLPFHLQFVAGAIAGVSEIVTMYPLDGKFYASFPGKKVLMLV